MNSMSIDLLLENLHSTENVLGAMTAAYLIVVMACFLTATLALANSKRLLIPVIAVVVTAAAVVSLLTFRPMLEESAQDYVEQAKAQVEDELIDMYGVAAVSVHGLRGEDVSDRELMLSLGGYQDELVDATVKVDGDKYLYGVELHDGSPVLVRLPSTNAPEPDDLKESSEEE